MRAAHTASSTQRCGRLAIAFALAISMVTIPTDPALAATDTYGDDFEFSFSRSTGTASWATDWLEWGEGDGAASGAIIADTEVHCPGGGADPCLVIGKGGPAEVAIEREVDLSLASAATLEFSIDRHVHTEITSHGTVELAVSGNGGTDWTPLETWDLSVDPGVVEDLSYPLAGHLSADTRIRFRQYGGASDSHINIDDLVITAENDLSGYAGGIVINEVLFDHSPAGDEEFVELFNATPATVSLAGWRFDNRAGSAFYTFPPGASLGPDEYAVVWLGTHDPGGLRDAPEAAFQDGVGEVSNYFWDNGDAIWLHDAGGLRVDFVAWGTGSPSPPPEWDDSFQTAYDGAVTARGQSISLTPNGVDGNDSACWEPTTSGDAAGRCAGYLSTADGPPTAQLWTPGYSNHGPPPNSPPAFGQDLPDRADSEGVLLSISAEATDPDPADTLTYSAVGLPEGISINPGTGLIAGALGPNSSGIHPVTITVTDNGFPNEQDIDIFTWTVSAGEVAYLVANNGGGNGGDDLLTAVDLTDPDPATNEITIGTGTGTTNIEAIALQPGTDTLYAVENDQLGTIDITTGEFTPLPSVVGSGNGAVGLITFDNIESLAFNPYSGHLYATHRRGDYNEDVLLRIDPTTGAAIPGVFGSDDYVSVQETGAFYHAADIAFDPTDGQLYAIHWTFLGSFSIATIDPVTGATATLGSLPDDVHGLAFDESGGLWGTTADTAAPYFLYEFDKTDASVISTTTIDNGDNYESIAISFPFNPNQPPTFDQDLLDRSDPEGTTISISAGATDPDPADVLSYSATGLPPGLTINPTSGLISGTIDYAATGTYPATITATDNGIPNLADTDTFTWTITETNQAPVFDQDLLDRTEAEGDSISISAAATDPDLTDMLLWAAAGLPAGIGIDPGTGLISGTVPFTAAGTYPITITVTDDGTPNLNDTDTYTWTITNTNRPPVIVNPGAQTTPELAAFSLVIAASDPDLTTPSFSDGGTLPAWATLTDNLDGTATVSGLPGGGDSATTTVTVTADDGFLTDDAVFSLTVTNTNLPPVIVNPGNQVGAENVAFSLTLSATDPDTTIPTFSGSGLPGWATLTDNGDGTATLAGTPGYDDAGTTTVTITADDGALTDDAVFDIDIANTNRAPTVDPIGDQTVAETAPFSLIVSASDPDLTIPALSAAGLPGWATFTDNGDGTATLAGTPGYTDAASTTVTITATDGTLTDDETFTLTVTNTNRAPTVDPIADQSVAETAPFSLIVSGSDPDLTIPFLNVTGLPAWAGFTDNEDGTATITGTPGYTDAGAHLVTITATDDGPLSATETFTLTVTNTNQAPVVDPIANATVAEADTLTPIIVTASDPDLTIPTLSSAGLPAWAGFTDNEDGTATITGTPGYTNAGAHLITITATDGTLTNDDLFSLTVTNTNQAPIAVDDAVLLPADAVSVVVSVLLNDGDPDDDPISLTSFDSTTVGALTEEGPGLFRYTPGTGAPYAETFSYTISDTAGLTATATVFLSVTVPAALPPTPVVELPSLIGLAPISGAELDVVRFTAGASTPADVRFALVDGPPGATIHPVTGVFTWTPTERQGPGEYTLRVRMTDPADELLDDRPIAVTITELHSTPRLRPAGPFHIEPGTTLTATIRADDVDVPSSPPRYELSGPVLPGVSIHPATGLLTWDVPADQDSGQTTITLRAVDGSDPGLYDEMTITVTVGAESSSDRRATLISGLLTASDEPGFTSPAGVAESGVKRTLVIMARAGMGSARAFGAPFALLALLTVIVLAFGRVSIHPLLGRSKRMAGTVAWFDAESGYGFIIPDRSAEELFLHRTALTRGKTAVTPGDRVTFRTVKGSERSFALRVRDEGES